MRRLKKKGDRLSDDSTLVERKGISGVYKEKGSKEKRGGGRTTKKHGTGRKERDPYQRFDF